MHTIKLYSTSLLRPGTIPTTSVSMPIKAWMRQAASRVMRNKSWAPSLKKDHLRGFASDAKRKRERRGKCKEIE